MRFGFTVSRDVQEVAGKVTEVCLSLRGGKGAELFLLIYFFFQMWDNRTIKHFDGKDCVQIPSLSKDTKELRR